MPASRTAVSRSWWLLLVYGLAAVVFGIVTLIWPARSVAVLVMAFGLLSTVDGVVSLFSIFRKDIALPNWLLLLYAVVSIGFGILALVQPALVADALLWLLAVWLIVAGVARIAFAIQIRKLIRGEWLLAASGAVAILLGVLFLARPDVGIVTLAVWIALGALVYGILQVVLAIRLKRRLSPLAA